LVAIFNELAAPVKIDTECWVGVTQKAMEIIKETFVRRNIESGL